MLEISRKYFGKTLEIFWKYQYFGTQPMQLSIIAGLEFWSCLGPIRSNSNQGFVQNLNAEILCRQRQLCLQDFKWFDYFWFDLHHTACIRSTDSVPHSSIPQYLQGHLKNARFVWTYILHICNKSPLYG